MYTKIGFFEASSGERSLSAVISLLSFFASVLFGYVTITTPAASVDVGVWITGMFLATSGGLKLGRTGIAAWSENKKQQNTVATAEVKCNT